MAKSKYEIQVRAMLDLLLPSNPVQEEVRFHPERRWRFDFAYPELKIAIEVEGGTWTGKGHAHPTVYQKDCEKYNAATMAGWRVYRLTPKMITLEYLEEILFSFVEQLSE